LGIALYQISFFAAVQKAGVGVATVIAIGSSPVFAGVIGKLLFHERLSLKWRISTALAVSGGAMLSSGGLSEGGPVEAGGALLALAAGFAYSLQGVGVKMAGGVRTSMEMTTAIFMVSGVLLLPLLFTRSSLWIFTGRGAAVVLALSVLSSAIPFLLFNKGLMEVGLARAYTLSLSEPITACLLSAFLLGQKLAPIAVAGVAVICAATLLLAVDASPDGSIENFKACN
jgi:DME family drug/metabolite transporter